jgi:ankyrin repeat protein
MPLVELLLTRGANIDESADDGSSAILIATVRGHIALAKRLLERGAVPDGDLVRAAYAPLHWPSTKSEGIITLDYPNAPGEWAALAGIPDRAAKLDLIRALVARGANVNARATKDIPRYGYTIFKRNYLAGGTPFYMAALAGDVEVMRLLVAGGADPNIPARDNTTPLMVAAGLVNNDTESVIPEADHFAAVKLAYELGNDIDQVNTGGFTAAHAAAFAGYNSVIQFLADNGAKLSEKNKAGQTPLGIAEGNTLTVFLFDRPKTAELLRKLGAKSEGAITLQSFITGKTKSNGSGARRFDQEDPAVTPQQEQK